MDSQAATSYSAMKANALLWGFGVRTLLKILWQYQMLIIELLTYYTYSGADYKRVSVVLSSNCAVMMFRKRSRNNHYDYIFNLPKCQMNASHSLFKHILLVTSCMMRNGIQSGSDISVFSGWKLHFDSRDIKTTADKILDFFLCSKGKQNTRVL